MLSRLAAEFADEIRNHDWSDAPFRTDRAGHRRELDPKSHQYGQLSAIETVGVRTNVMWVVAQVLSYSDPNFDIFEFAERCGVDTRTPSGRPNSGFITAGLRYSRSGNGQVAKPGSYE